MRGRSGSLWSRLRSAVLAMFLFGIAPGLAQAQFFGADWGEFDSGYIGAFDAGYSLQAAPDAPYAFGMPGFDTDFSVEGFSPYSNPHFGLGVYPNGMEGDVGELNDVFVVGAPSENRYRPRTTPKPAPKTAAKKTPDSTPKSKTKSTTKPKAKSSTPKS
jgi:hypothetical protein